MNKKGITPLILGLPIVTTIIIAAIVALLISLFVFFPAARQGQLDSEDLVLRPLFGSYQCVESDLDQTLTKNIPKDGITIKCPATTFGKCDVVVDSSGAGTSRRRLLYSYCDSPSSCNPPITKDFASGRPNSFRIPQNLFVDGQPKYVNLIWQRLGFPSWQNHQDDPSTTYTITYRPSAVLKIDPCSGSRIKINTAGESECELPSSDPDFINQLKSSTVPEIDRQANFKRTLAKGEISNYVCDFVLASQVNIETFNGQDAYCVNNKMYGLDSLTTRGNTFKIVNLNFNSVIDTVQCCNGESRAGQVCEEHNWIDLEQAQCSLTKPCAGFGDFVRNTDNENEVVKFGCVSGQCEIVDRKIVECTSPSQCLSNEVCQDFICQATSTKEEGEGTPRDIDQTKELCEQGGGQFVEEKTSTCGFGCQLGLTQPKEVTETRCVTLIQQIVPILAWGLVVLVLIGLIVFLGFRLRALRSR